MSDGTGDIVDSVYGNEPATCFKFPSNSPVTSSPSMAPTASGAASDAAVGRPWHTPWPSVIETAFVQAAVERSHRALQDDTGLVR